jgi:hypothetical protein
MMRVARHSCAQATREENTPVRQVPYAWPNCETQSVRRSPIGEAIIRYLQHGRPRSATDYVFVAAQLPHGRIRPAPMHQLVSTRMLALGISLFADVQLRFALPRVSPSRLQAHIAARVAALTKTMRIFQRQQVGKRDQRPQARSGSLPHSLEAIGCSRRPSRKQDAEGPRMPVNFLLACDKPRVRGSPDWAFLRLA